MGLNDREYMREVPEYLRLTGRSVDGSTRPAVGRPVTSRRYRQHRSIGHGIGLYVAIIACVVALIAAAYLDQHRHRTVTGPASAPTATLAHARGHPVVMPQRRIGLIRGTRLLSFGGTLALTGQAVPMPGLVRVLGRWNSGHWQTFAVANADGHSYRFKFPLDHRGTLRLRVVQPNGYASVATYHVS